MNTITTELAKYIHHFPHLKTRENQQGDSHMTKEQRNPRLTIAQKSEIIKHFKEHGLNGQEIHDITGIPYHQISKYLQKVKQRRGLAKEEKIISRELNGGLDKSGKVKSVNSQNRRSPSPETVEKIRGMVIAQVPFAEIARQLGISETTVGRYADGSYRRDMNRGVMKTRKATYTTKPHTPTAPVAEKSLKDQLLSELKSKLLDELKHDLIKELLK